MLAELLSVVKDMVPLLEHYYQKCSLKPTLRADLDISSDVVFIETMHDRIRKVSVVAGAAFIVQEYQGEQQRTAAAAMLAKRRRLLPKALAAALDAITSPSVALAAVSVKRRRIVSESVDVAASSLALQDGSA